MRGYSRCILLIAGATMACADLGPNALDVRLTIAPSSMPGEIRVMATVTNTSQRRIVWGQGSSNCQLEVDVLLDGVWRAILPNRICFADLTDLDLDPGATRKELFVWHGDLERGSGPSPVPPGSYILRGRAGFVGISAQMKVALRGTPR